MNRIKNLSKSKNKCDICGSDRGKVKFCSKANKYLCYKHYGQFNRYGRTLDSSPRTINDLNEIIDNNDGTSCILLYNKYGKEINRSIIDTNDVEKVKNIKWRISKKRNKTYVVSGKRNTLTYLSRFILDYNGDLEVDHIDGNELNNSKENLRIIDRIDNIINVKPKSNNKLGIRGVSYYEKGNKYIVDFSFKNERFFLKPFDKLEEAIYLRYLFEINFLKEFRNTSNDEKINNYISLLSESQKNDIEKYFLYKVKEHENKKNNL